MCIRDSACTAAWLGGLPFVVRVALLACIGGLAFVVYAFGGFLLWLLPAYAFLTIASLCKYYMLYYVDDILLAGDLPTITGTEQAIARHFKCDDLGEANLFLGIKIIRNRSQRTLWLGQLRYALEMLERAGLSDCRSRCTPLDPNLQILRTLGRDHQK